MKKYIIMILLLFITLTCVNATNDTTQDVIGDIQEESDTSAIDSSTDDLQESTHHVNTSDNLHDAITDANNVQSSSKYTLELDDDLTIDEEIDNEYLNLVINGNNHQLTVNNLKFTNANNITINNLILELNNHIDNYVDLNLNNVTVRSTKLYDNITKALSDNGITEFSDENYNRISEIFYGINTNHGNIHNYKNLYVNNSMFTRTMAYTGSAIYNHGYLSVDNTLFDDTLSIAGVVYSEESLRVTNSRFTNNRQCAYLLHSDTGDITCINNSFENNYALYNSGVSSSANTLVENCNFTNNTASSMNSINNNGNMTVINCNFKDNNGEIINNVGKLTVTNCVFENNTDMNDISNNYLIDGETDEIISIGNMTLLNNTFLNNHDNPLIYNGASITLLNNTFYNVSDVLDEIEPGKRLFDEIVSDTDTDLFNRSIHVESNIFIMDSEGVTDDVIIRNQTNYVQHKQRYSLITLDEINNVTDGESVIISGYLTDAEGNPIMDDVNINISDYAYYIETTYSDGFFSYECSPNPGIYDVTVTYDKNPYIKPYTITASFTVNDLVEEDNQTEESEDTNHTDDDLSHENDTSSDSNVTYNNDTVEIVNYTDVPSDVNYTDVPSDVNYTDVPSDVNYTDVPSDVNYTDVPSDENYTDISTDNQNITNMNNTELNNTDYSSENTSNIDSNVTDSSKDSNVTKVSTNSTKNTDDADSNYQNTINRNENLNNSITKKNLLKNINRLNQNSQDNNNNQDNIQNENNIEELDNSTSAMDNSSGSDANNQESNPQNNNQSDNIIPIAIAAIALIAIIGAVIIKR